MDITLRKDVKVLVSLWLFFSILFLMVPALDIITSSIFYDSQSGSFPLKNSTLLHHLNNFGRWFIFPIAVWPIVVVGFKSVPFKLSQALLYVIFYTCSVFILVEYGIKEIWLRPRPEQITLFGGTQPFLSLFQSLPHGNFHSFVSGHTAVWFGLICIGYTVYPQQHRLWTFLSLITGCIMGYLRICIGEHFLSDTIFAGLFVCSACVILDIVKEKLKKTLLNGN